MGPAARPLAMPAAPKQVLVLGVLAPVLPGRRGLPGLHLTLTRAR